MERFSDYTGVKILEESIPKEKITPITVRKLSDESLGQFIRWHKNKRDRVYRVCMAEFTRRQNTKESGCLKTGGHFPCDARNHRNAIANEKATTEWLTKNAEKIFPELKGLKYEVKHAGGTGNKADNIIVMEDGTEIYISDKQKISGLGGSSDWSNTSLAIKEMLLNDNPAVKSISNVLEQVREIRNKPIEQRMKQLPKFRRFVKEACSNTLKSLTSKDLTEWIEKHLIRTNRNQIEVVTDQKNRVRYVFAWEEHPVVGLLEDGYKPFIEAKPGSSSAHIKFRKGREVKNIGLRLRIHTNNGVSALLNIGKGNNKNSSFVIKFQQDNLKKLLESVDAKSFDYES